MNFHNVEFETSFGLPQQLPESDLLEIAFSGRSNVGKSSMINKLFNRRQLARVSSMPGKTTTINFFKLENVRFVDLPGYGYAKRSKSEIARWGRLMEGYFSQERNLALVFQLIDIRHAPTQDDLQMLEFLVEGEFPFVVVLTKKDKLSNAQFERRIEELQKEIPWAEEITMVPFSSLTGEGVEEIRSIVEELAAADEDAPTED